MPTDLIPEWPRLTTAQRLETLHSALNAVAASVTVLKDVVEALHVGLSEVEEKKGGEIHGEG